MTTLIRPLSVKLDPDIRARIEHLAGARRRTAHWLMREAIREYVEREEKRDAFRSATVAAWEAFQATGQHLKDHEAEAWLESLENGQDIEPPLCHS